MCKHEHIWFIHSAITLLVTSITCEVNQESVYVHIPDVAIVCPSPPLGGSDSHGGG